MLRFYISLFIFLSATSVFSQQEKRELIQFSGVVVSGDSLSPVPYASIIIKGSYRGTISDYYGFFSFVAREKDTIEFTSVGFKTTTYVIPDTLTTNRYSLIQILTKDTILLDETVVFPWPSREQFKEAFLNLRIPDDDMTRAQRNLAQAEMRERLEGMPMDGQMNYNYQMQKYQSQLYYAGQYPPNNLLNPVAWAKFIQAWKNGEFKRKTD